MRYGRERTVGRSWRRRSEGGQQHEETRGEEMREERDTREIAGAALATATTHTSYDIDTGAAEYMVCMPTHTASRCVTAVGLQPRVRVSTDAAQ